MASSEPHSRLDDYHRLTKGWKVYRCVEGEERIDPTKSVYVRRASTSGAISFGYIAEGLRMGIFVPSTYAGGLEEGIADMFRRKQLQNAHVMRLLDPAAES